MSFPALRHLLFLLPCVALPMWVSAAEPAWAPVKLSAEQSKALGVTTQGVQAASDGAAVAGLPALVVVPNGQLRVIAAPAPALVEQLLVAPGETVKRGQALGKLASPQLLEWQRDARQAQAQATLTQQALARDEALFKEGIIAEARLQATQAAHSQAAALLAERQGLLGLSGAGSGGGTAVLRAPFDGVILEQLATVGQRVEAAAPLFKLGQLKPLWLEIQAPAALAASLQPGAVVQVPAVGAKGKLLQVGRQVSSGQTLTLRASIDQNADKLVPGQMVEASVASAAGTDSKADNKGEVLWRVPTAAIWRQQNQTYVFVAGKDGFVARAVTVKGSAGSDSLLAGGFSQGETVAVSGVSSLKASALGVGANE
jgi:RND family efflux transporter MFP subunit